MKEFACKDLGIDCSFVATGNTVDEVKKEGHGPRNREACRFAKKDGSYGRTKGRI